MEKIPRNGKTEVENASGREERLRQRLFALNEARNQVLKDAETARLEINAIFSSMRITLMENLESKKLELLKKVETIKDDALAPFSECCANVESQMLRSPDAQESGQQKIRDGRSSSSSLDDGSISSLPEILKSCDIPSISVYFNTKAMNQCLAGISCLGRVSFNNSVKIVESKEKPGALAILWEELETDFSLDLENMQYRLQHCQGDANVDGRLEDGNFLDAYVGPDTFCVVRNLKLNVNHSFRVCRIRTSTVDEDEWSKVHVAITTVSPYEWDPMIGDYYEISDERRIAAKQKSGPCTLHSNGPQFGRSHSLQFAILECGSSVQPSEGLGLTLEKIGQDSTPIRPGTVFVNCEGLVFVDGVQTSTRLPGLSPGCALTFESEEELRNYKMRVMITCEGKRVTYDWRVVGDQGQDPRSSISRGIYFFSHFFEQGWRVRVE